MNEATVCIDAPLDVVLPVLLRSPVVSSAEPAEGDGSVWLTLGADSFATLSGDTWVGYQVALAFRDYSAERLVPNTAARRVYGWLLANTSWSVRLQDEDSGEVIASRRGQLVWESQDPQRGLDPGELLDADEPRRGDLVGTSSGAAGTPHTVASLLDGLGVLDASREEQDAAVAAWLAENAPDDLLAEALEDEGIDISEEWR